MIDSYNFKDPKNDFAITAFAGPLSNLLLAFIGFLVHIPIVFFIGNTIINEFLAYLIIINISLAVFNMLPIPPLDGSKVLGVILPKHLYFRMLGADRIGFFILIILLLTDRQIGVLSYIIDVPRGALINAMQLLAEKIYFFL